MSLYKLLFYPILIIVFLDITKTTAVETQYWIFYITPLLLFLFLIEKKKISYYILLGIVSWFLINLGVTIFFGKEFLLIRSVRFVTTMMLFPFLILKIYEKKFLIKLEQLFYILTIISLPLYILNIFFIEDFNSLYSLFKSFTNPILAETINYWSTGIYVNAITQSYGGFELFRNCGFMWEPGYFALIIIVSIIIHLLLHGIKLDFRILLYSLALVTTFSTAGYAALFVIYSGIIIKKLSLSRIIILTISIIIFFYYVYGLEFIGGKIDTYSVAVDADVQNYASVYSAIKLNRFQIAIYDIYRVINYPFGYGFHNTMGFDSSIDVVGTNGLTGLMRMWGLPIFILFLMLFYRFLHALNPMKINERVYIVLYTSLLIVFFSQSIQHNILTYFIIIFSIIFYKSTYNEKK